MIAGFMVPHPPMIVPEVGRGSESIIEETIEAYEGVADMIAGIRPDTVIISSPHSIMYADYFHISPGSGAEGSFARFGAPEVEMSVEYDRELVQLISERAESAGLPAGTSGERDPSLDHGTMVPLYFILRKYSDFKLVRIGLSGLSLADHYKLGMEISQAVESLGRRAVYVASGDLSHKLKTHGPYGFAPEGPEYDERIMEVMASSEFDRLFDFDEDFLDRAAECGHRSFVMMAGVFDRTEVSVKRLSHQDVTGVGYGICTYKTVTDSEGRPSRTEDRAFLDKWEHREMEELTRKKEGEDAYVRLARLSLESYIKNGTPITWESEGITVLDKEVSFEKRNEAEKGLTERRAGAFVSIHKNGRLRGCIGTIGPVTDKLADEIIANAISASTRDPRFSAITEDELPYLEINVDVLSEAEPIASRAELDVKRYGVIVTKGYRRGLLLPDLEGVDTVDEQVAIACSKAGISPDEDGISMERFEVVRHI
jgi:AmmeMemoRadiSam system protein A/AmmeMemoRadiSam system protein B